MSRCRTCGHDAAKLQERLESARRRIEFWENGPHKVPAAAPADDAPPPALPAPPVAATFSLQRWFSIMLARHS